MREWPLPRQQVSPVAVAPGREITPEMVRTRAIVPYDSQVQQTVRRLDQVAEVGSAIGRAGQGMVEAGKVAFAPVAAAAGPIIGTTIGHALGTATGFPAHGLIVGGALGSFQREEMFSYTKETAQMAGQFSLAMAQLKMRFLLELTNLGLEQGNKQARACLLYTSPSPRDATLSRMPSSA